MTKIFCIGFIILTSVPALYAAIDSFLRTLREFRKTEGEIVDSSIEAKPLPAEGCLITTYGPKIQFAYMVDGESYLSDTLSFKRVTTTDIDREERIRKRFPPGKEVQVYYNPKDPSEAYLSPPSKFTGEMIGYILVILIVAIALIAFMWAVV